VRSCYFWSSKFFLYFCRPNTTRALCTQVAFPGLRAFISPQLGLRPRYARKYDKGAKHAWDSRFNIKNSYRKILITHLLFIEKKVLSQNFNRAAISIPIKKSSSYALTRKLVTQNNSFQKFSFSGWRKHNWYITD
jgi:hypothetical protein